MKKALIILVIGVLIGEICSCKKDKFLTDSSAKLHFSADSVLFDTVFTTIGSATRNIRVINKNKQKVKISAINLQKANASPFILNVDGAPGKSFTDIEIAANDSIYIFIQVNVNPTNQNSPLIIDDHLLFSINGNTQSVYLEAWGQDAYYHKPTNALKFANGGYLAYSAIGPLGTATTVTWNNDKPHVIYSWLVVDSAHTLIINQGVRVHFHQNAGLWVYKFGTLKVNGVKDNEVKFQGDRFEKEIADIPGQWDRIWINEGSSENEINYAIIKNGFIGVQAELLGNQFNEVKRLKITNTKIQNMSKWGIYGLAFNIYGGNNIISNCKEYCAVLALGGKYTFLHSTFVNYWNKDNRTIPAIHIDNHTDTQTLPLDSCYFGNCIIDGSLGNELEIDLNPTPTPSLVFSHCVLKASFSNDGNRYINCRLAPANLKDYFKDAPNYGFELKQGSIAIDMGAGALNDASKFPTDILNKNRGVDPDAGAYEFNP